ncbi:hypothetical protein AB0E63_44805 [Kribbella sp. NPDC026596]|uniref:hypothetical protein n=1 Tax=Kribbella sp. NPDC026596 TaxID=3155122 RepID=UPI0033D15C38
MDLSNWLALAGLVVAVAGVAFGLYQPFRKRRKRAESLQDVVNLRRTKVLFDVAAPDHALKALAGSAYQWRAKCAEAQNLTKPNSPAWNDLEVCMAAAAAFRFEVESMLPGLPGSSDVVTQGPEMNRLLELRSELRDATEEPSGRLASKPPGYFKAKKA